MINLLLKDYGFHDPSEYYQMIVDSIINGQRTQARALFSAMPRYNRKGCIVWLCHTDNNNKIHIPYLDCNDVYMLIMLI